MMSCVVLTRGERPRGLEVAIASARAVGADELVVVGNGCAPQLPTADRVVALTRNVGIPEGRNVGAAAARGDLLLFLDDDARCVTPGLAGEATARFRADPRLGAVGLGIDTGGGGGSRRHSPGLTRRSAIRAGPATSFPGGAVVIRADAFHDVGGFAGPFFYALEETDLAWRLLDRGWRVRYEPGLRVEHPDADPLRHPAFRHRTARNRAWLAHRQLPVPLAIAYLLDWLAVDIVRNWRRPAEVGGTVRGMWDGLRHPLGPRRPMAWSTVWKMIRLGRPPVI